MQKLDFNDEGKLVAYTNNGCTNGKSVTTEIDGTFEVSADVVKFIIAKEYELPAFIEFDYDIPSLMANLCKRHSAYKVSFIDNKVFEPMAIAFNKLQYDHAELLKANNVFLDAIDEFNKSRYFFERKFKFGKNG